LVVEIGIGTMWQMKYLGHKHIIHYRKVINATNKKTQNISLIEWHRKNKLIVNKIFTVKCQSVNLTQEMNYESIEFSQNENDQWRKKRLHKTEDLL
jgi:hypothetical protein